MFLKSPLKNAAIGAAYIHLANTIPSTHGKKGLDKIQKLEELFKENSNSKLFLKLLELMCKASNDPKYIEEEKLLHI